jgi:DHA1 family bicyclomycin/chloramphenicol resistance-like MFS transporter
VQESLASYFIGIAFGQALYGPLSDRLGRKPALYLGLTIFIGASLGCAFTTSVTQLVVFRFLQALGGCAPLVVPRAVVRDYFDGPESVRMLSMLVLVMMLGPILAPFIGGQLLIHFGWRSVFFVLAGYGLTWLVLAAWLLPESLRPAQRRRESVATIAATYLRILRDRQYLGRVLTGGFVFAGLLAYISGSSFVYIELFHVPPERFGLYFGANAVGLMLASQINRYLAGRVHPEVIVGTVLPVAAGRWRDAARGRLHRLWRLCRHPGAALLLRDLHGFVGPNTTALAMSPVRSRGRVGVGAHGHDAVRARGRDGELVSALRQRDRRAVRGRDRRVRARGVRRAPHDAAAVRTGEDRLRRGHEDARRAVYPARCRKAISTVSVMGLSKVVTHTTLVTKLGATSNSSARIVGDDRRWHRRLQHAGLQRRPLQAQQVRDAERRERSRHEREERRHDHHGGTVGPGRPFELHAEHEHHHRQGGIAQERHGPRDGVGHREPQGQGEPAASAP